ncbi:MAG: C40 family peptidase [Actinobacteria bacterium]|nr:C40 family peptidase [Actinomycetota bacterium]
MNSLTQQISAAQTTIARADQARQLAEQDYARAAEQLSDAQNAEAAALIDEARARTEADAARGRLVSTVRTNYMGSRPSAVGALLIAADPQSAINAIVDTQLLSKRQAKATAEAQQAHDQLVSAEARTGAALHEQATATAEANRALLAAQTADDQAKAALADLQAKLLAAQLNEQQAAAMLALAQFDGVAPLSAADQAALTAAYKTKASQVAAQPMAPATGHWSAAVGQSVVNRALQWLGTPYSFAAGNKLGPTLGVNSGGGGERDGSIIGFDCSGLALYAWAPYLSLYHYAATQYATAGSLHPAVTDLLPGDLVFWSGDGTAAGIGHVAIYVGNGNVIQAPESGDVVKITPLASVESGYFGATRPLT